MTGETQSKSRVSFTRSVVTAVTHGRTKQRPAPALAARRGVKAKATAKALARAGRRGHLPQPREPAAPAAARARPQRRPGRTAPCSDRRPGTGDPRPERVRGGAKRRRRRRRGAPLTRAGRPRTIQRRSGGTATARQPPEKGPLAAKPGPEWRKPRPAARHQSAKSG
jgi:hypothetical protein